MVVIGLVFTSLKTRGLRFQNSLLPFLSWSIPHGWRAKSSAAGETGLNFSISQTKFIEDILDRSALCFNFESEERASFEATGAVKVIIQSAHIGPLHGWKRPPSPFVSIHVNSTQASTDAQAETYAARAYSECTLIFFRDSYDPSWMAQTFFLLVKSPKEKIKLILYDHHVHRKHGLLGSASFDMSLLTESAIVLDARLPLLKGEKHRGDLLCSLFYYPISKSLDDKNSK